MGDERRADTGKALRRSDGLTPRWSRRRRTLAGLLRRLGENNDADALLSELRSPSGMFIYHMVCSEIDAAADSLAKAFAQGEMQPLMWFGASDFLKPLRSTLRWPAIAKMMNLPPETIAN